MQTISFINLSLTLIPLILVWYFYKKWTGDNYEIIYSTVRMLIQLIAIGYVLLYLFEEKNIFIGSLIMLFMIMVSTFITIRNTEDHTLSHYIQIFTAIAIAGLINLFLIIWNPQLMS